MKAGDESGVTGHGSGTRERIRAMANDPINPMDDDSLDELELGQRNYEGEDALGGLPPRRRERGVWLWVLLALLGVAALVYFFWWRNRPEASSPATDPAVAEAPRPASQESAEKPEQIALPELDRSDAAIRQLLETLSDHPALATLLVPDQLVRRFVASVDNVAEGVSPRPHLAFMQPKAGFHTVLSEGELVATAETHARYDRWARLLASLDPSEVARMYGRLEPLFQEAYADLGYPRADFRDTLVRAIDRLLAVPDVQADTPLVANVSSYSYRDARLEALGPVEKHFARMGPGNVSRVREQLAEIRAALLADASTASPDEPSAPAEPAETTPTPQVAG